MNDCTRVDTLATTYLHKTGSKGGSRWGLRGRRRVRMNYVAMSFDIVASQSEEVGWQSCREESVCTHPNTVAP